MSNEQTQFDPETASMEELEARANEEIASQVEDAADARQDEVGVAGQPQGESEEVDEIVYRRVIDLGDGSGVQVFEADSPEALIEKLANAQEHATRKIRELSAASKPAPVTLTKEQQQELADQEYLLSQQFLQSPTKAFADLFKRTTGMTVEEFKAGQQETTKLTRAQQDFQTGREFTETHPDFYPSERNAQRMEKWLRMEGLATTPDNLEKAFADLTDSGLLEARPAEETQQTTQRQATRIAEPQRKVVGQRRAASGLSSRGSSRSGAAAEPSEDDLYNMSYDELKARANAEARQR